MNDYSRANEIAKLWDVTERQVQILCKLGKIEGAVKFGTTWAIPKNSKKPTVTRNTKPGPHSSLT